MPFANEKLEIWDWSQRKNKKHISNSQIVHIIKEVSKKKNSSFYFISYLFWLYIGKYSYTIVNYPSFKTNPGFSAQSVSKWH